MNKIKIKRIYKESQEDDGIRILIDRLWPRGIRKEEANIDLWLKDLAPSNELRKFFSHDRQKWSEFKHNYINELKNKKEIFDDLNKALIKNNVTLLYAAKDEKYNHAVVLKEYLEEFYTINK